MTPFLLYFYGSGWWTEENDIYNNAVYNNGTMGLYCQGHEDHTAADTFNNNNIKNNIFFGNDSDGNREAEFIWGAENASTAKGRGSGNVYTHNCFGAEASNFIEWGDGTDIATYDAWETAYGSSTYSVESDPLMADPANDDFTLQGGSPCLATGTDVSLTRDYTGNVVTNPPSIGAYEKNMGEGSSLSMTLRM